MKKTILFVCAFVLTLAPLRVQAAVVTLDLQVNQAAKTFSVFALLDSAPSDGLASFSLDILGTSGATVTSTLLAAPRPLDINLGEFTGFSEFRSNGTIGAGSSTQIRASQDTIGALAGDRTIRDYGVGTPVLLATGAYTAAPFQGLLTARVTPGFFFNVLPDNWTPGTSTVAATSVVSSIVAVPEPSTVGFALCGAVAGLCLLRKKYYIRKS